MGRSYTMHCGNRASSWADVGAIMDWIDRAYSKSSKDCWYLRSTSVCVCERGESKATRSLWKDTGE